MLSWETGVAFGQALADLRSLDKRTSVLEQDHAELKAEVHTLKSVIMRAALLLALWTAGLVTNLPADRLGEATASLLKALSK